MDVPHAASSSHILLQDEAAYSRHGHIASESQLNWNDRVAPTGTSADVK